MTEYIAAAGTDTWVRDDRVNRNQADGNRIRLQASHRLGLVHIPISGIRGRTVLSATMVGHVRTGFAAQTVTVKPVTDSWSAGKVTWANRPAVGTGVSTALGALADGVAANLDVTSLVQDVANGADWRGVQLSTTAATAGQSDWYALDSGQPSWSLVIELSDAPEQPSDLRPNVGAVGISRPILAWSYTDLGGTSSEQGGFRVEVDPAADGVSPDFDTGWVTSSDPQYDLASGSFTALTSGASTQWRVQTKDADGNLSQWSDWATFSYVPYPVLVMDSPTGGVIGDPTPDVIAHLTGGTLDHWRVRVLDTAGTVLWDSGLSDGALAVTVPLRNDDGVRVIKRDDATYQVQVRAWDDVDRAVVVGHTGYVQQVVDVVFDEDAGVTTPTSLTVGAFSPGDPRLTFTWHCTLAADAWLIIRDGAVHERIDAGDVTLSAGVYSWTDAGQTPPYESHTYVVRAIESGARSHASNAVTYNSKPRFAWLIPEPDSGIDPIALDSRDGNASLDEYQTKDRRGTYQPLNSDTDIDIVYGQEGISGTYDGGLPVNTGQAIEAAATRLGKLKADVAQRPRLVYNNRSIRVTLRNLTVEPTGDYTDAQRLYRVRFDFIQSGD